MISGYGKRGGGYGRGISEQGLFYHFNLERSYSLYLLIPVRPSFLKKRFRFKSISFLCIDKF